MDIRNFFGGGGGSATSSQSAKPKDANSNIVPAKGSSSKAAPKKTPPKTKSKSSAAAVKGSKLATKDKKKDVHKSDDDDVQIIDSDTEDFNGTKSSVPAPAAVAAKSTSAKDELNKFSRQPKMQESQPPVTEAKKQTPTATVGDSSSLPKSTGKKDSHKLEKSVTSSKTCEVKRSAELKEKKAVPKEEKHPVKAKSKEPSDSEEMESESPFVRKNSSRSKKRRKISSSDEDIFDNETESKANQSSAKKKVKSKASKLDSEDESDDDKNKSVSKTKAKAKSSKSKPVNDDIFDDESACSPSPKKQKSKSKVTPISDTESDEDPLPEHLREGKQKRRSQKRRHHDSDEEKPSIIDAMSRLQAKQTAKPAKPTPATVEVEKKVISPADFFGMTPVQMSASKKEKKDTSNVRTDRESSATENNNQPDKPDAETAEPKKKIKLDREMEDTPTKMEDTPTKMEDTPTKADAGKATLSGKLAKKKSETEKESSSKMPAVEARRKDVSPEKPKNESTPSEKPKTKTEKTAEKAVSPAKPNNPATPARQLAEESKDDDSNEKGSMQKKGSFYRGFLNREPPRALGTKDLPQGQDNCLEGMTFVLTGVLESIDRDDTKSLIERYGGKVTQAVSKNTSYLVAGRDSGESKTKKATQLGTKMLDEDGLFNLIRTLPGKKSKYEIMAEKEMEKMEKSATPSSKRSLTATPKSSQARSDTATPRSGAATPRNSVATPSTQDSQATTQYTQSPDVSANVGDGSTPESLLWVDKYKPTNMKQIIGQQGDKSNAKKLLAWLTNWHANLGKKPAFGRSVDDGAGHKAALLSGPPGIGKTTSAQIVCETAGFSFVELNASDTRSKRSLQEEVSEALNNHTLVDFFGSSHASDGANGQKHCLVMDEVDGMAGNEDRGGVQELIQLIKHTKIPVICMCNDRNHPKIRSLSNYCFDLRFQRPRIEQIKGPLLSIVYKEGLKIPPVALNDIIAAANHDIRQVIHNLSMWTAKDKSLTYDQLKAEAAKAQKDLKLGPFDVCRKVFVGGDETSNMTLVDKMELFFHDYSIAPLFVQENYTSVTPFAARNTKQHLRCLSRAADGIACGDLVDAYIRRGQMWNLLPTQSIFASVVPGEAMRGSIAQMIQFPSWLGKNSTTTKNDRIIQELGHHMRLHISANRRSLNMEYLPYLRRLVTSPLVSEGSAGVESTVSMLNAYDLLREDFDSILEVTNWSTTKDPMSAVDSKVKAAFTRAYNKTSHLTPYSTIAVAKKRGRQPAGGDDLDGLYEEGAEEGGNGPADSEHSDDDDLAIDGMIKKKAAPKKPAAAKNFDLPAKQPKKSQAKGKGQTKTSAPKRGGKK